MSFIPRWAWTLPIILVAFALALVGAKRDGLWLDEIITDTLLMRGVDEPRDVQEVLELLVGDGVWPPLYMLMQYFWGHIAGWSAFAGRLIPALTGVLTLATMYRFGRLLGGTATGLMAVALLGTTAFAIHYWHEIRGYALYLWLNTLGMWAYWRLVRAKPEEHVPRFYWLALLGGLTGTLYTHYVAAVSVAALGLYHLIFRRGTHRAAPITRTFFAVAILYAPWLAIMLGGTVTFAQRSAAVALETSEIVVALGYALSNGLTLLLIAGFVFALLRVRSSAMTYLLVWVALTLAAALLFNVRISYLIHLRHLILMLSGVIPVLALVGVYVYRRMPFVALAIMAVWMTAGVLASQSGAFMEQLPNHLRTLTTDLIEEAQTIQAECAQTDSLMLFHLSMPSAEWENDPTIAYHFRAAGWSLAQVATLDPEAPPRPSWLEGAEHRTQAERLLPGRDAIWLVLWRDLPLMPQVNTVEQVLEAEYPYCGIWRRGPAWSIVVYSQAPGAYCPNTNASSVLESCQKALLTHEYHSR